MNFIKKIVKIKRGFKKFMKKFYFLSLFFPGIIFFKIIFAFTTPTDFFCVQVITPAKNPKTGECREFSTPCAVPEGWVKVKSCAADQTEIKDQILVCQDLYWYDDVKRECQGPKKFCGAFMYQGLRTFKTKEECQEDLQKQDFYLSPQPSLLPTIPALKKEKKVPVGQPLDLCALSDNYLSQINDLVKEAELFRNQGDLEGEKNILEKIRILKEKIEQSKKECAKMLETKTKIEKNDAEILKEVCQTKEKIEKKVEYYKELLSFPLEEIEKRGYKKEEIEKILNELLLEKEKIKSLCSGEKLKEEVGIIKPVVPEDSKEIVNYYKEKVASIIEKPSFPESQVQEIKKLNQETQEMAKELIRTKEQISLKEAQNLFEKIELQAGKIKINEEEVKASQEKNIEVMINKKPVTISVSEKKANLKEENLTVELEAPFVLEKEKAFFQNQEIKATPKEALSKADLKNPQVLSIKLRLKENQPVYEIKAVEERKFFFVFPVKVKKEIILDATKEEFSKIEEKKPWWSFFAF